MWFPSPFFVTSRSTTLLRDRALLFSSLTFVSDKLNLDLSNFASLPDSTAIDGAEVTALLLSIVALYYGVIYISNFVWESLNFETEEAHALVEELLGHAINESETPTTNRVLQEAIDKRGKSAHATQISGRMVQVLSIGLPFIAFVYVLFFFVVRIDVIIQMFN